MLAILVLSTALSLVACKPHERHRALLLRVHPIVTFRFVRPYMNACPELPPVDSSVGCPSGKSVVVQPGDTCQTIAVGNSVAAQTFPRINDLKPSCSDLIAGSTLCLPKPCETQLVQPGDTCEKIAHSLASPSQSLRTSTRNQGPVHQSAG